MKFFYHTLDNIRIINGTLEYNGHPNDFQMREPDYMELPEGIIERYWTPEQSFLSDGIDRQPLDVNCQPFIDNVSAYLQQLNIIYAHVTLSKTSLCIHSTPQDLIIFDAHIKPTDDPTFPDLPVFETWYIRLRHENGSAFDSFEANFVNGSCSKQYVYEDGLPLGVWYLDPADFIPVTVGDNTYVIALAQPVEFTIYRSLADGGS